MKTRLLLLVTLLPFLSFAQAPIDTVDIPDGHFKWALLNPGFMGMDIIDTNGDGEIQYSEAEAVTFLQLDPSVMGGYSIENNIYNTQNDDSFDVGPIDDLTGIEAFTGLKHLNVRFNNLTTLDLSQNTQLDTLYAEYNQLTTLELGNNPHLKLLLCNDNDIQSLDVTQLTGLIELGCHKNQIDSLNLKNAPDLQFLRCETNNLSYLDVRNKNGGLNSCHAGINPDLTCIYVDDKEYAENAPYWSKDSTAHYVETEEECEALGVEDYVFQDISVYPNPVTDHLSLEGLKDPVHVALYDVQGKKIWTKSSKEKDAMFDVSFLNTGLYFLQVTVQNTSKTFKIVKL